MRVLMLSIDSKIFKKGSAVRARMIQYGALFDELHIVIYTQSDFVGEKIALNVFIYPTNTKTKLFYFWHAYHISKKILNIKYQIPNTSWVVTCQEAATSLVAILLKWRFGIRFQAQVHTDFASSYFKKESLKNWWGLWGYFWGAEERSLHRCREKEDCRFVGYKIQNKKYKIHDGAYFC